MPAFQRLTRPHAPGGGVRPGRTADGDPNQRVIPGVGEDLVFFLPLHPGEEDGLLSGLRRASAEGDPWLVIADDGAEDLIVYTRRSLEAFVSDNARWVDADVRVYGVLGPYPVQVADGYRWFGWCRPRFTAATVDTIAADLATLTAPNPPQSRVRLRRHGDTVEIVLGHGTARQHSELVPADAAGMFAVDGSLWCWETVPRDDPGHVVVGRPTAATTAPRQPTRPSHAVHHLRHTPGHHRLGPVIGRRWATCPAAGVELSMDRPTKPLARHRQGLGGHSRNPSKEEGAHSASAPITP